MEGQARKGIERIAGSPRQNKCAICSLEGKTVFDHCHVTGKFRAGSAIDATEYWVPSKILLICC